MTKTEYIVAFVDGIRKLDDEWNKFLSARANKIVKEGYRMGIFEHRDEFVLFAQTPRGVAFVVDKDYHRLEYIQAESVMNPCDDEECEECSCECECGNEKDNEKDETLN